MADKQNPPPPAAGAVTCPNCGGVKRVPGGGMCHTCWGKGTVTAAPPVDQTWPIAVRAFPEDMGRANRCLAALREYHATAVAPLEAERDCLLNGLRAANHCHGELDACEVERDDLRAKLTAAQAGEARLREACDPHRLPGGRPRRRTWGGHDMSDFPHDVDEQNCSLCGGDIDVYLCRCQAVNSPRDDEEKDDRRRAELRFVCGNLVQSVVPLDVRDVQRLARFLDDYAQRMKDIP